MKKPKRGTGRQHPRVPLTAAVQYQIDGKVYEARLVEISEGGLRLENGEPLSPGVTLRLFVPMPAGPDGRLHMCLLTGQVVWSQAKVVGIQFVDPSIDSLLELRKSTRKRLGSRRENGV